MKNRKQITFFAIIGFFVFILGLIIFASFGSRKNNSTETLSNNSQSEENTEKITETKVIKNLPEATLIVVSPDVLVIRSNGEKYELKEEDKEFTVYEEDKIITSEFGSAYMVFSNNSILTLDSETEIIVDIYEEKENNLIVKIQQIAGSTWSKVEKILNGEIDYSIETSQTLASVRGTEFGCDIIEGEPIFYTDEGVINIKLTNIKTTDGGEIDFDLKIGEEFEGNKEIFEELKKINKKELKEKIKNHIKKHIPKEDKEEFVKFTKCLSSGGSGCGDTLKELKKELKKIKEEENKDNENGDNLPIYYPPTNPTPEPTTQPEDNTNPTPDPTIPTPDTTNPDTTSNIDNSSSSGGSSGGGGSSSSNTPTVSSVEIHYDDTNDVLCKWIATNSSQFDVSVNSSTNIIESISAQTVTPDTTNNEYSYMFHDTAVTSGETYTCKVRGINGNLVSTQIVSNSKYLDLTTGEITATHPIDGQTFDGRIAGTGWVENAPPDHFEVKYYIQRLRDDLYLDNSNNWTSTTHWFHLNLEADNTGMLSTTTFDFDTHSYSHAIDTGLKIQFKLKNKYSGKILHDPNVLILSDLSNVSILNDNILRNVTCDWDGTAGEYYVTLTDVANGSSPFADATVTDGYTDITFHSFEVFYQSSYYCNVKAIDGSPANIESSPELYISSHPGWVDIDWVEIIKGAGFNGKDSFHITGEVYNMNPSDLYMYYSFEELPEGSPQMFYTGGGVTSSVETTFFGGPAINTIGNYFEFTNAINSESLDFGTSIAAGDLIGLRIDFKDISNGQHFDIAMPGPAGSPTSPAYEVEFTVP